MPAVDAVPSPRRRRYRRCSWCAGAHWSPESSPSTGRPESIRTTSCPLLPGGTRRQRPAALRPRTVRPGRPPGARRGRRPRPSALAWCVQLLGSHPDVLGRLQTEADTVLGGSIATWDDLPDLTFTHRVVQEVLRLYPPAWAITRTTVEPVELAGSSSPWAAR
ncbi:cytochrome P450 [Streptomyces sp. KL116D]|uniref:cytochrome P450 n=1 Tax=Streptomyces sp. KL116D TaxID=3045152 RepID=UPI003558755D